MIAVLLYCAVCYLVMFGILLNERDHLSEWTKQDVFAFIFSFIFVPIFIGIHMSENDHNSDSWQD